MKLIDGDRIVTAQLYDDEHEEFTEEKMSIIDYVNAYTDEGVTMADDVLDKIRAEIENHCGLTKENHCRYCPYCSSVMVVREILEIIDKYKAENALGEVGESS